MRVRQSPVIADPGCNPAPATMIRLMNGQEVDRKTLHDKASVIGCGNLLPTSNAIYGFTSDDEFQEWAACLPVADAIHGAYRFIREAQKYENDDLASVAAAWADYVDGTATVLKTLARREGIAETSRELFLTAEGLSGHPLEPKVLHSAVLYQHINFGGSWRPVSATIPALSWIGFNDTTSSVRMSGTGFLAQDTWWRGRKFWMLGIPYMEFPDLRNFDFNDRASSVLMT